MRGIFSANLYVGSVGNAQTLLLLALPTTKPIEIINATMSNASNTTGEQLLSGLYTVSNPNPSFVITTAALTLDVVTITTSANHGFVVSEVVQISGLTHDFLNGTYTVASVPTPTTFTYSLSHTDLVSGSDSGLTASLPVIINNVALTSDVVTISTATPYGWVVGQSVIIAGLANSFLNGIYVVASTPTTTTFTYALTNDDLTSTADVGTASFFPTAEPVTITPLEGEQTTLVLGFGPVTANEPTYYANALHQDGWSSQIGYRYQPFVEGRPVISASGIVGLRLLHDPGTSFNAVGEIVYREMG